jgi:hypothetical protein
LPALPCSSSLAAKSLLKHLLLTPLPPPKPLRPLMPPLLRPLTPLPPTRWPLLRPLALPMRWPRLLTPLLLPLRPLLTPLPLLLRRKQSNLDITKMMFRKGVAARRPPFFLGRIKI